MHSTAVFFAEGILYLKYARTNTVCNYLHELISIVVNIKLAISQVVGTIMRENCVKLVPSLVDLPMFLNVVLKLGTKLPYSRKFSHYFVCTCSTYKNLNDPKFSMNLDLSTCGEDRIQEASSLPRDLCSVIQSKRLINLE